MPCPFQLNPSLLSMRCGLTVRVFKLLYLLNVSSDNPNKTSALHVVLIIIITWHKVKELTLETLFLLFSKKQETIFVFYFYNPIPLVLATFQCHLDWSMLGFLIPDSEMAYLPLGWYMYIQKCVNTRYHRPNTRLKARNKYCTFQFFWMSWKGRGQNNIVIVTFFFTF